ncbi:hypothetical protein C4D60_Mb02t15390 [Musa balbisiana]|uniref:Bifunctional inhibitor/plant lipid transfer protein/seed storage helical domain-containing protein n=1 Tax=Musa balbisiana TaxID=52838 RepID=A0A4S8IC94_MUSBA|nr:hypothetical protein C4D60_Mb02t15390 [Musa balbisiana]
MVDSFSDEQEAYGDLSSLGGLATTVAIPVSWNAHDLFAKMDVLFVLCRPHMKHRSLIIPPLHCNTHFFLSKMKPSSVVFFCLISALLLLRSPTAAESVTCDPTLLKPCAASFLFSTRPSSLCCSRIKSQVPCYCQYLNDPSLSGYVSGGKKVAAACGVSLPSC